MAASRRVDDYKEIRFMFEVPPPSYVLVPAPFPANMIFDPRYLFDAKHGVLVPLGQTQPQLFVLSIVLANSHRGKLSRLSGSTVGCHLVGSKIDHSQKVHEL